MLEYFKEQIKDEIVGAKKYIQLAMKTKASKSEHYAEVMYMHQAYTK